MSEIAAPGNNTRIYDRLFLIENVIRELLIVELGAVAGPRWYKSRLPQEALEHFRLGIAADRSNKWTRNVPHHPVYYLGFPDLRLTIENRDNWNDAFKSIFPRNKELVTTDLVELEFVRNKIAHNRHASDEDLAIVTAAYGKLMSTLGTVTSSKLLGQYSIALTIPHQLAALSRELSVSFSITTTGKRLKHLPLSTAVAAEWWWLDELYLGCSVDKIHALVIALLDVRDGRQTTAHDAFPALYRGARSELERAAGLWVESTPL